MSAQLDQWTFTSKYEGVFNHLYLDSRNNVTAGAGFLVRDPKLLALWPWSPSAAGAVADFQAVSSAPQGYKAGWYKKLTVATLSKQAIRTIFDQKIDEFRAQLQRKGWKLETHPLEAQIAVVDMAYTLGESGLRNGFPEFRKALSAHDYARAADESLRLGVQASRNLATRQLLLSARFADGT